MRDPPGDDRDSVIVRVVEDLDLESLTWPVQLAHCVENALGHIPLVVDRHLDADPWFLSARDWLMDSMPEAGRSPCEEEDVGAKAE
jgi:hypothetical protein